MIASFHWWRGLNLMSQKRWDGKTAAIPVVYLLRCLWHRTNLYPCRMGVVQPGCSLCFWDTFKYKRNLNVTRKNVKSSKPWQQFLPEDPFCGFTSRFSPLTLFALRALKADICDIHYRSEHNWNWLRGHGIMFWNQKRPQITRAWGSLKEQAGLGGRDRWFIGRWRNMRSGMCVCVWGGRGGWNDIYTYENIGGGLGIK